MFSTYISLAELCNNKILDCLLKFIEFTEIFIHNKLMEINYETSLINEGKFYR